MQPPKKGPAFWEAEVTKMIKVYRAPIEAEQAKAIAAYLGATY
jgi:sulfite dehydrogenase (cytochrome) subunit B